MKEHSPSDTTSGPAPDASGGARILLVEDDPDSLALMGQIVEGAGYEVTRVATGFQALAKAKASRYDLVLLDVMLPGVDGFEVCHRLRREPTTSEVPILLISAKGRDEDVETGMRVGATAYLLKPISRIDLLAAIQQHLVGPKGIA